MASARHAAAGRGAVSSPHGAWSARLYPRAAKPVGTLVRFLYRCERWATHSPGSVRAQEAWLTGDQSPLDREQIALCAGIPHDISRRDTMYRGNLEHYWRVACPRWRASTRC